MLRRAFAAAEHGLFYVTKWSKKVGGETEASPRRGRSGRASPGRGNASAALTEGICSATIFLKAHRASPQPDLAGSIDAPNVFDIGMRHC